MCEWYKQASKGEEKINIIIIISVRSKMMFMTTIWDEDEMGRKRLLLKPAFGLNVDRENHKRKQIKRDRNLKKEISLT